MSTRPRGALFDGRGESRKRESLVGDERRTGVVLDEDPSRLPVPPVPYEILWKKKC